ncbi:unnamed protein product [Musa acuminata subsp. malaccensis]|uniref:(wild Malaysian banana) hypothetical protein n=1 Tax=Musa acuminata subsp. malaccensis TaxID=214687 RepID=A0A8D6ZNU2_MUSAM|nr:unnamed protein product [Musa acuminata subsp. malaccensis]
MESYIRPGRVINLFKNAVNCMEGSQFLVHTNRQLVSHKGWEDPFVKTWRAWSFPELTVSPIAVVGELETSLVLKGSQFDCSWHQTHCIYIGKYMLKEVLFSTYPGTICDDSCVERFSFPGGSPKASGRCFIEVVENGFKGNSFPIIIADTSICQELRALESEFEEDVQTTNVIAEEHVNSAGPRSREVV